MSEIFAFIMFAFFVLTGLSSLPLPYFTILNASAVLDSVFRMSAGDGSEYSKCRVFASLPQTKRGFPTVLGSSPNGQKIIYCNGNSVFIVDVENITDVDIYTEHSVPTTVAKMSPSGFGHVFLFDTGTSNGNLSGQSRPMSSIDFRPARPYRLISGSEDNTVAIFEGPPFKFKTTFHEHTRFVHVTKYNPDGSLFASASADGKVVLFEGAEGAKVAELVDPSVKGEAAHTGSVFGLAWSPCGKKIATASADKTVKIWGVDEKTLEKTVHFGDAVEDQQVGIVWGPKALVSVSLAGFLSFIDSSAGQVTKVLHGHNKGITTLALSECKQWLFTSDFEGHINSPRSTSVKLPSQPLDLASAQEGGLTIVACYKNVLVFKDSKVHIFTLSGTKLSEEKTLPHSSPITKVAFSPNGEYLVATDSGRKVRVDFFLSFDSHLMLNLSQVVPYSVNDGYKTIAEKEWTFHTAKVNCVAWSPNNRHIATGGLDTNVIVWDLQRSGEHPIIIRGDSFICAGSLMVHTVMDA
ncbi:hypothetical protein ANCCEY_06942 [Ancylostoma ceylanicum]|uniref:Uncharacterized protein n=1 Tax=Ancylostoma ceylanicum TaxID=53326 RepID=A0A0D6LPJ4_9BILA|nr:hypothetical protein ANCCEY_06942 [Ancylostoma ceylanicum]